MDGSLAFWFILDIRHFCHHTWTSISWLSWMIQHPLPSPLRRVVKRDRLFSWHLAHECHCVNWMRNFDTVHFKHTGRKRISEGWYLSTLAPHAYPDEHTCLQTHYRQTLCVSHVCLRATPTAFWGSSTASGVQRRRHQGRGTLCGHAAGHEDANPSPLDSACAFPAGYTASCNHPAHNILRAPSSQIHFKSSFHSAYFICSCLWT